MACFLFGVIDTLLFVCTGSVNFLASSTPVKSKFMTPSTNLVGIAHL
ncbi:hypothetical protein [Candidatus Mycoplasma haematohominis]|uniref:Uncharacterized protein n=1 Tax=Candidatus Mycoplasma haematohominis TaxID=1494318 RepID=A0A478FQX4_9MOLU|nr:hypothetical protein [Candidatus Mycoplasma haemohominis]GCE63931.1 hypothetical protein MHSWG343_09380 [Candidatus Mycoplasma haemohominis]